MVSDPARHNSWRNNPPPLNAAQCKIQTTHRTPTLPSRSLYNPQPLNKDEGEGAAAAVNQPLLLLGQNGLLPLALALLELLVRVLPLVLVAPLDGRQLLALDLARLLDDLGQVPVAPDALDLGHVRVPLHQGVVVLERLPLLGRLDPAPLRRVGAPQPDVALSEVC